MWGVLGPKLRPITFDPVPIFKDLNLTFVKPTQKHLIEYHMLAEHKCNGLKHGLQKKN